MYGYIDVDIDVDIDIDININIDIKGVEVCGEKEEFELSRLNVGQIFTERDIAPNACLFISILVTDRACHDRVYVFTCKCVCLRVYVQFYTPRLTHGLHSLPTGFHLD